MEFDEFTADRFYGMADPSEVAHAAEIVAMAQEFRSDVELVWTRGTAHPDSRDRAGRYSPEGQCAVTMHLFVEKLKGRWPDLEVENMIGSVEDDAGTPFTTNHVWAELKTADDRTLVIDLTPDQEEGIGRDAPTTVIGYADELAEQGYHYVARAVNNAPAENPRLLPRYNVLHRRYERFLENKEFYQQLANQNIYIVGGVATGKTQLAKRLERALPRMNAIDVGNLFRIASTAILDESEASPQSIDAGLLERVQAGDAEAADTFVGLLRRKTAMLRTAFASVDLAKGNDSNGFTQDGKNVEEALMTEAVESLVPHVAKAPNVRRVVWDWINGHAAEEGNLILTGHSLTDIDTTKYMVVELGADAQVAARRLMERSPGAYESLEDAERAVVERNRHDGLTVTQDILSYLGIERIDTNGLDEESVTYAALRKALLVTRQGVEHRRSQSEVELSREDFKWEVNGMISGIRTSGADIYASIIEQERERDPDHAPTEFDLAVQTMISLCSREPSEVWQGNDALVARIAGFVSAGDAGQANALLAAALESGTLHLNEELVREAALSQVVRLRELSTARYGDFYLPAYGNPETSPFEHTSAEATSKGREITTLPDGSREMRVREKHSGKVITLKRVAPEISDAYAKGFHYLHAGRDDEYEAFGAYVDDSPFPFAWVSYSPVDRAYKKEMLQYFKIEPHRMLEMTRAWNASWSPKNTMSLLFSFAHSEMQQEWQRAVDNGERDKPLAGIITAINPNLGFRANAFNGVDFGVIGLKPAGFTYLLDEAGNATYTPRRSVAKALGVAEAELETHPRFARNRMPLLPTNEMAVIFKGTSRLQVQEPIYRIPDSAYKSAR